MILSIFLQLSTDRNRNDRAGRKTHPRPRTIPYLCGAASTPVEMCRSISWTALPPSARRNYCRRKIERIVRLCGLVERSGQGMNLRSYCVKLCTRSLRETLRLTGFWLSCILRLNLPGAAVLIFPAFIEGPTHLFSTMNFRVAISAGSMQ